MLYKLAKDEVDLLLNSYTNPKFIKDDWVIVNKKEYTKIKNKITLTSADFYLNKVKITNEDKKEYYNKQIFVTGESKNKYILIKYNGNFIAVNIADNEYGLSINPMKLIFARNITDKNILQELKDPPSFKYLLDLLGWKITKKAKQNIENNDDYF